MYEVTPLLTFKLVFECMNMTKAQTEFLSCSYKREMIKDSFLDNFNW